MSQVEYLSYPKLNKPLLLACWPGVGQVASIGIKYLKEELKAVEFAQLNMRECFDLGGVLVEDNIIQPFRFPRNTFSYWQNSTGGQDLILFEGEMQPSFKAYELGNQVLEVAQQLGTERVITIAAALVADPPLKPRVWITASSSSLCGELERCGGVLKGDFYISGMNGSLLAIAREMRMETICLLGETLQDFPHHPNPIAALSVLQVLANYLNLPIDLTRLRNWAKKARKEFEELVMQRRKEFIDRFTVPLWKQEEDS